MTARQANDYTRCPRCHHRKVLVQAGDHALRCIGKRCGWEAHRSGDDQSAIAAWEAVNTGHQHWPARATGKQVTL